MQPNGPAICAVRVFKVQSFHFTKIARFGKISFNYSTSPAWRMIACYPTYFLSLIIFLSVRWQLHTYWAFLDFSMAGVNAQCVCNF